MSVLWTASEAARATGGKALGAWQASNVSIDSRSVEPGAIFIALQGARDGHEYVAEALAKGAAAAMVTRVPPRLADNAPLLIVEDTQAGLENLARAARARVDAVVLGVTGSVGKTGTKEMLRTALGNQGRVHAAERSLNNHLGVPLTLARMPRDTGYAVLEIGMNHPGEIAPLARLARLDVAVITAVAPVHLAAFANVDEIARAKAEIFDGLKPGGGAVINRDTETFGILRRAAAAAGARILTFGASADSGFRCRSIRVDGNATTVEASAGGAGLKFRLGAPGRHLAFNALAVLAAVDAAGADATKAARALARWRVPPGRGSRFRVHPVPGNSGWIEVVDESYNANPTSMGAAFDVLAMSTPTGGRRIAILGDMLELGRDEIALHAGLARHPAMGGIDVVHTVGSLMRALHAELPDDRSGEWFESAEALADRVAGLLDIGDVAMVKGSAATGLGRVVEAILALDSHPRDGIET